MKNLVRGIAALSCASSAAIAAPFLAIGDTAELFLTGTAGIRADDNIFLNTNKQDDVIFEVAPGVEVTFGKNSLTTGKFSYTESFNRYADTEGVDSELSNLGFSTNFDDDKLKLGLNASYQQLNQNTREQSGLGTLARRDVLNAGATAEVAVSEKTAVGGGLSYGDTNYKRAGYVDNSEISIPVNFYYELTPKVDLSLGFRYRATDVDTGADSDDYFYNLGARGEFGPKLVGSFSIGVNNRSYDGTRGDDTTLGLNSSFTYLYSAKTNFNFGVSNDFGTGAQAQSQENFSVTAGVTSAVSEEWRLGANVAYRKIEYLSAVGLDQNREDDYIELSLTTTYVINAYVSVTGGYTFRDNSSSRVNADFSNNVFSLAASVRY